jgi:hypothetical protein
MTLIEIRKADGTLVGLATRAATTPLPQTVSAVVVERITVVA